MIKIFHVAGRFAPSFVCDACGKRIERFADGVALSSIPSSDTGVLSIEEMAALSDVGGPEEYEVFHVHKGKCMAALEDRFQVERMSTGGDGFDEHIYYLARNLGLTLEDLRRVENDLE